MTNLAIEHRTFTENPFYILRIFGPVIVALAFASIGAIGFLGAPPARAGSLGPTGIMSALGAGFIFFFIVVWFWASFSKKLTIGCGPNGCDIDESKYWGSYHRSDSFRWEEVTNTELIEESVGRGGKNLYISIEVQNRPRRLLTRKIGPGRNFRDLLDLINRATPHLPCVWEPTTQVGNRQVIVEVMSYSKVARV